MPNTRSPGVFIEEVLSSRNPISGVNTSVTAFVGRAERGPVNVAVTIHGFSDYETIFGGLDLNSAMSFAVRDYFLNGGSEAVIGRLYEPTPDDADFALINVDGLELVAISQGSWANSLRVRVDHDISSEDASQMGLAQSDLFNLSIKDTGTGVEEHYINLSVADGPNRIDNILFDRSRLVRVLRPQAMPDTIPAANAIVQAGDDEFAINTPVTNYVVTTQAVDSAPLTINSYIATGNRAAQRGLYVVNQADIFNLLCLPAEGSDDYPLGLMAAATSLCGKKRTMLIVDPHSSWTNKSLVLAGVDSYIEGRSSNAALFFPKLKQANPLRDNQIEEFPPCGAVAGIIARTDLTRGVWKAPAGVEAILRGISDLSLNLDNIDNNDLNSAGINCLRSLSGIGRVVWGARTEMGSDALASEWKYIPVRRTALFIEESVERGLQWTVFETNDDSLWAQIRLNVNSFMHNLFSQGAFQGNTQNDAYFVKCDSETTTLNDIEQGHVNIIVGFAPLKPAEFVILKLQLNAGQL